MMDECDAVLHPRTRGVENSCAFKVHRRTAVNTKSPNENPDKGLCHRSEPNSRREESELMIDNGRNEAVAHIVPHPTMTPSSPDCPRSTLTMASNVNRPLFDDYIEEGRSANFIDFPTLPLNLRDSFEPPSLDNDGSGTVLKPVPLRPSVTRPSQHNHSFGSDGRRAQGRMLELSLDCETPSIFDDGFFHLDVCDVEGPQKLRIPNLRLRPMRSSRSEREIETPSPLARRGAEERAYLQSQLKAETLRRKKQEQRNREWRRRASLESNDKTAPCDKVIDSMIDTFNLAFPKGMVASNEGEKRAVTANASRVFRDLAGSPPAVLKDSFRRSVSSILADSGMNDGDDFVLFFPDGAPFLDDDDGEVATGKVASAMSKADIVGQRSFDETCSLSTDDKNDDDSPRASHLASTNSSPSISPHPFSVIGEGRGLSCLAASKSNKKVMLRPKMALLPDDAEASTTMELKNDEEVLHDIHEISAPNENGVFHCLSSSLDENKCTPLSGSSFITNQRAHVGGISKKSFALTASESFQQLSHGDIVDNSGFYDSDNDHLPLFDFSSSECRLIPHSKSSVANERVDRESPCPHSIGVSLDMKQAPFESNFHTPDHSRESSSFQRKAFGPKLLCRGSGTLMSTLPEQYLPRFPNPKNCDGSLDAKSDISNPSLHKNNVNSNDYLQESELEDISEQVNFNDQSFSFQSPAISSTPTNPTSSIHSETLKTPC
mmetsp:Transcript_31006/g.61841  ORF Transcript_31006/g.61841 Transcript_31006/m.61841 type:complete len:719 (+) Transcript_31006:35-2191(+)